MTKRRLVLLLDGTWNEDDDYDLDTNIVRLRNVIADGLANDFYDTPRSISEVNSRDSTEAVVGARSYGGRDYLIFYERGVGTGPGLDRLFGGALGWGLSQSVRRAYKFLSRSYMPGSEIFIFGFSRGAYTARSLVGYLASAGLLREDYCNSNLERQAWQHYRTPPNDRLPATRKQLERYSHSANELRIACLGVFDTVGTLGIPNSFFKRFNRQKYEFHDVDLSPIVKLNLHALAIDECRSEFAASVWRQTKFKVSNSVTEQTWFTGVHADIGGGYFKAKERAESAARGLDDISLDWMLKRIQHHYPDFPIADRAFARMTYAPQRLGVQHNSRTGFYRLSPLALRSIANVPTELLAGEVAVSYNRDATVVGESIHVSALERLARLAPVSRLDDEERYLPRNLLDNFANLYSKYCEPAERPWGPETLSITSWAGNVVVPEREYDNEVSNDSNYADGRKKNDELAYVRGILVEAYDRLKSLGYDVLSESWDSRSVAPSLKDRISRLTRN